MARIIDVIEWPDQGSTDIMQRVPEQGAGDIRIGSQVIARGSQVAVFFRDGKALDVFREGRYTLSTMNIPILASIINLGTNNKTPFPAEVYFVTTKDFIGQKWGTPNELTVPDSMMGVVQLRAHGTYSFAISDPQRFVTQIVGAQGIYTTGQLADYLRDIMVSEVASVIGATMAKSSLLNLAALQSDLGAAIQAKAADDFDAIGIALKKVYVVGITPSEETAKALSARSAMGALGVNYMQYQGAQAMRDAAQNTGGGVASLGAGLGAGMGIGGMMSQAINSGMQTPQQPMQPAQPAAPAAPAGSGDAPMTKAAIQKALSNLDVRVANGEISETLYNKLTANLQKALDAAAE
ncbi:MAG TPA: SPFH domain-containing protein [Thermoflexales bacterium]|nr:SPFH domain-containing protein [Anaerolineae bacterium]HQX10164.1 SPFH domain-containing protein [Thermoflexales bacterium]HQY26047.1 SPFH domain-containing protein [Thermoflexales bacterium]